MAEDGTQDDALKGGENITPPEGEAAKPDERVPYERFQKANQKAKEAADRATKLEQDLADLRKQIDERETAGLPELERERKAREQLEQRTKDAERRADEAEQAVQRTQRERWIAAAAARENFVDPDDAARYLDVTDIEDTEQADRAVKRLAKAKKHLVKPEDAGTPPIGRVLEGGKPANGAKQPGDIDLNAEAEMLAGALAKLARN